MGVRGAIYKVSTWDHEKNGWCAYVTRVRKWGLRKVIRSLRRYGWTSVSVLIERRDGDSSGERWPRKRGVVRFKSTKEPARA